MKRAILVHNKTAGRGKYTAAELVEWLAEAGFRARHIDAKNKRQLRSLRAVRGGLIVVAGGDGTVGKVARRVAGNGAALAVLPLGTANNIARSLGLAGEPRALIAGLKRARLKKVDVGIAKGPWGRRVFLEGVGAGLFADVMAALDGGRAARRKRSAGGETGKTRFAPHDKHLERPLQALAETLPHYKAKATHVSIDGHEVSGRFLLVAAMNMPLFGPNLHLVPDADPGDGRFDIVLLGEDHREEFQGYLQHRLEGGKDAPKLTVRKGKRLRFEWGGRNLHIDDKSVSMRDGGDAGGASKVVRIKIERGALAFLVPRVGNSAAQSGRKPKMPRRGKRWLFSGGRNG